MTTLSTRLARAPLRARFSPARGFWRVLAALDLIMEVFVESKQMARDAQRRWPFSAE